MPNFTTPDSDTLPVPAHNVHEAFPPAKAKKPPVEEEYDEDEEDDEEPDLSEEELADMVDKAKHKKKMRPRMEMAEATGEEIHTAKWHRCIQHVQGQKGGGRYNPYAVCTSSIGVGGSYAAGHGGGRGRPKRRTREALLDPCPKLCTQADPRSDQCRECMATLKETCPYRNDTDPACQLCVREQRRVTEAAMDAVVEEFLR